MHLYLIMAAKQRKKNIQTHMLVHMLETDNIMIPNYTLEGAPKIAHFFCTP